MRSARRVLQGESGTSTLEFALVIPVVILLVVAAFDFTRALLAYTTITSGSREGARYAVLHPSASVSSIEKAVEDRTRPLSRSALSITVEWRYRGDDVAAFASWPPPATRPPRDLTVRISVRYPWAAASALAAGFFVSATPAPTMVSTSFMDMQR
jgi:TadE-like protein